MKRTRILLAVGVLTSAVAPVAQPQAPPTLPSPSRELWHGTEGRFVRQWLLLAPLSPAAADTLAAAQHATDATEPREGQEQPTGATPAPRWRAHTSWGDVVDGFGSTAPLQPGEVGLAFATVTREHAGDAVLSLGGTVGGVWVNGAQVHGATNAPAFVIDGTQVRVSLREGTNRILLQVARGDRPPFFALRVLEPGFVLDTSGNVAPYVTAEGATLRVALGATGAGGAPGVEYVVVGAGGRVMAQDSRPRREEPRFDSTPWPDGAYEVRLTTRDSRGAVVVTHLSWYKGDAGAAARQLVADARDTPADGHLAMLADMVRDRAAGPVDRLTAADWPRLHSPLLEREELGLERSGRTGGARAFGFVRLAWVDDVDGSAQFCRAYLPGEYATDTRWPAVVWLHGWHPENPPYVRWWSIGDRHNGVAERQRTIVLEPFGRGNVDYRWIGERDVLRCLAEARRRFAIDDDRVYLGGESMGGNGTWLVASRHPQLFAAAAPVFGGWDYRLPPADLYNDPRATRPAELFAREVQSSFAGAEGLRHVPLLVVHGDGDASVPVGYSRHAMRMLQRWGYDVRYHEVPGRGHEDLGLRDAIVSWLLEHRRVRDPREVRLRATELAGATAHWVEVTGWLDPLQLMEVHATIVQPGTIRLETRNVGSARLTPPRELVGGAADVRVVWNGEERSVAWSADGSLSLAADGVAPRPGDKSPAMEGRLTYFFGTPFAIVVGIASRDPEMVRVCREKAEALAGLWERWQHVRPRLLRDDEVTPEYERRYSLLLVGGPDANRVTARVAGRLPLAVARDGVTIDGRRFAATDAVAQMLHPSPLQPERYVLVVAATSTAGMRAWDPGGFWVQENGYPKLVWDFTVQDGRRAAEPGLGPERSWIAAGIFDRHWRRDDRFIAAGDDMPPARATPGR